MASAMIGSQAGFFAHKEYGTIERAACGFAALRGNQGPSAPIARRIGSSRPGADPGLAEGPAT